MAETFKLNQPRQHQLDPSDCKKQMQTRELEERVSKIEERNANVEADKAWETSWTRRALVMLFTYLAMSTYLWAIGVVDPWLNGIVPTVAFMISGLTMPFFKKEWLKHRNDRLHHSGGFGCRLIPR